MNITVFMSSLVGKDSVYVEKATEFGVWMAKNGHTMVFGGTLVGKAKGVKAHLECHGLMLSEDGYISAIPQLDALTNEAEMSHEAAVGRIAPEEIEYLMARGLSEEEATATIVRGFLNINIEGLPESLAKKIQETLDTFNYAKGL